MTTKYASLSLWAFALYFATSLAYGQPLSADSTSLGLFKNGVAAFEQTYALPTPGEYLIPYPKDALHGALFLSSNTVFSAVSTREEIDIPLTEISDFDWLADFKGKRLRVTLPGEKESTVVTVVNSTVKKPQANAYADPYSGVIRSDAPSSGVLLQCENGEVVWVANARELRNVVSLDGIPETVKREREVIRVVVPQSEEYPQEGAVLRITYLATGISWAPQYRLDLRDNNVLTLEQTAVIVNDRCDIENAEVALFSGYPQILMKNTTSPLDPSVSLNAFFSTLQNASNALGRNVGMSQMAMNMVRNNASTNASIADNGLEGVGDGVDIFAQKIGKLSLKKGDRALISIAKREAEYERLTCWNIVDVRDQNGRPRPLNMLSDSEAINTQYGRTTSGESVYSSTNPFEEPWDVVKFRNPFEFPLTTGPVYIADSSSFLAQNTLYWTNPNELASVPVTKALSVRARSIENERMLGAQTELPAPKDWGENVTIAGVPYRVAAIDAKIELVNQRSEPAVVCLSRQYSGELIEGSLTGSESEPKIVALTDAANTRNRRVNTPKEMQIEFTLKPKEKKTIQFSYRQLIAL